VSFVTHLECAKCAKEYSHRERANLCECGGPLLVRYDVNAIRESVTKTEIWVRAGSMWRYGEFLPAEEPESATTLGEGWTPILPLRRLGAKLGLPNLAVKDEGLNPTGTFKARGAAMGMTRARELGIRDVAMGTAGNAGGAWAAYGARAGINVHVAMPSDAPDLNKVECRSFGADLKLIDGLISDAVRWTAEQVKEQGWFDASTLKEPYRIEGKKTLGLEIAEQYGWRAPHAIIYPAGGGVGLIGIWKAYQELNAIGWIDPPAFPRLIAVQAAGCAPIVRAFEEGQTESRFWDGADTVAAGLRVPKALGDFLVLQGMSETNGCAVTATDEEITAAMSELSAEEGIFACPEGAATLVAARKLFETGVLLPEEQVLLINTGSAYKYPEVLSTI
jgi:threonine synthase